MWTHICSFDDLIPSTKGSKNLFCSGAEKWKDFFKKNSMHPALPALFSWPTRKSETGSKARLCHCKCFPSALNEFQDGCPLYSRVYLALKSAAKCYDAWRPQGRGGETVSSMCLPGRLWTKGCLGAADRKHASRRFMRKQEKDDLFWVHLFSVKWRTRVWSLVGCVHDVPSKQMCS